MATKAAFRNTLRRRGNLAVNRIAVMLLAAGLLLGGCQRQEENTITYYSMGTICTLDVYGSEEALQGAEQLMNELDARLSWRTEGSDVWNINQQGSTTVAEDTAYLIGQALEVSRISDGAFDPTMGILTREWDFQEGIVPPPETVSAKLGLVDYAQVELEGNTVTIGQGQALDLGGIAKGYAADRLQEYLREQGVESGIINLGGNVYIIGRRPDDACYRVGIRDPQGGADSAFCSISVEDKAVVISGPYEQSFEQDGRMYHHILDPETGYPAETGLLSVCIVADSSTLADGLSTAVFVMGEEAGMELIQSIDGVEAMLLNDQGEITYSSGFVAAYEPELMGNAGYVEKG